MVEQLKVLGLIFANQFPTFEQFSFRPKRFANDILVLLSAAAVSFPVVSFTVTLCNSGRLEMFFFVSTQQTVFCAFYVSCSKDVFGAEMLHNFVCFVKFLHFCENGEKKLSAICAFSRTTLSEISISERRLLWKTLFILIGFIFFNFFLTLSLQFGCGRQAVTEAKAERRQLHEL